MNFNIMNVSFRFKRKSMKKVILLFLALCVISVSCYKSVPGALTYSVNIANDSTVHDIYMASTGTYDLAMQVKYLAGYAEDPVTISLAGLPAGIKVATDTFTGVPTYTVHFILKDSNMAYGTYPVTLNCYTPTMGARAYNFNINVIPPDCGVSLGGTLSGSNVCSARSYNYTSTVTSGGVNKIVVNNFGGYGTNVNVVVNLDCINNTIRIDSLNYGNNTVLYGTGTFTSTGMTINYTATSTNLGFSESCTATYTK